MPVSYACDIVSLESAQLGVDLAAEPAVLLIKELPYGCQPEHDPISVTCSDMSYRSIRSNIHEKSVIVEEGATATFIEKVELVHMQHTHS